MKARVCFPLAVGILLFSMLLFTGCSFGAPRDDDFSSTQGAGHSPEPEPGKEQTDSWRLIGKKDTYYLVDNESSYVSYKYDENNLLYEERKTDIGGATRGETHISRYAYTPDGLLQSENYSTGAGKSTIIEYEYDDLGRRVHKSDAVGMSHRLAYFDGAFHGPAEVSAFRDDVLGGSFIVYDSDDTVNMPGFTRYLDSGAFHSKVDRKYDTYGNKIYERIAVDSENYTLYEWNYDEHSNPTREKCLNVINGEEQWLSEDTYINYYDDRNRLVFKCTKAEAPDGVYYLYNDLGQLVEEVWIESGSIVSNKVQIYSSDGLLLAVLIKMRSDPDDSDSNGRTGHNYTSFDYQNVKTGDIVSGSAYFENKYAFAYSIDTPNIDDVLVDIEALYEALTGDVAYRNMIDYQYPRQGPSMEFDSSITTSPQDSKDFTKYMRDYFSSDNQEGTQYVVDIPDSYVGWTTSYDGEWIGDEGYIQEGCTTKVYDSSGRSIFKVTCLASKYPPQVDKTFEVGLSPTREGMKVFILSEIEGITEKELEEYASWVKIP